MNVLVIDDDESIRNLFHMRLSRWGYAVRIADSGEKGLLLLKKQAADMVITDLKMPGMGGEEVVRRVKAEFPETEIIIITGYGTIEGAVEVMKAGAADFVLKPLDMGHIKILLERLGDQIELRKRHEKLKERLEDLQALAEERFSPDRVIGRSRAMKAVFALVKKIRDVDSNLLITGSTGAGKEVIARLVHFTGRRKNGPFLAVDCSALAENLLDSELFGHEKGAFTGAENRKKGRIERAEGGTLFLDEIGDTSEALQQKLLRLIQERTFERVGGEERLQADVRVIAATNRGLFDEKKGPGFRRDLFFRLNVIPIKIPDLKDRISDIEPLAHHFLAHFSGKYNRPTTKISDEALQKMKRHHWPGNVRELENLMERAVILGKGEVVNSIDIPIEIHDLSGTVRMNESDVSIPLKAFRKKVYREVEVKYLKKLLALNGGNIGSSARQAGIDNKTLSTKMKEYGLRKEDYRQTISDR